MADPGGRALEIAPTALRKLCDFIAGHVLAGVEVAGQDDLEAGRDREDAQRLRARARAVGFVNA